MRIPLIPNTLLLFLILMAVAIGFMLRAGYIPARYTPMLPLNLENDWGLFISWRIEALRNDRAACYKALSSPLITHRPVKNRPYVNGCGWLNATRIRKVAGASFNVQVNCPMAAALTMWMAHEVQPAAKKLLGSRVSAVSHVGSYSCRNIRGSVLSKYIKMKSEHATANAVDITGFRLANGKRITLLRNWNKGKKRKDTAEAKFLRRIHEGACKYFRVALGPEANRLHADHFHFDRGLLMRCK